MALGDTLPGPVSRRTYEEINGIVRRVESGRRSDGTGGAIDTLAAVVLVRHLHDPGSIIPCAAKAAP